MSTRIGRRIALSCCFFLVAAAGIARAQAPQTEDQKVVYALGVAVAQNLKGFYLSPEEVKLLVAGLTAGLGKGSPELDLVEYREKINKLAKDRTAARASVEREAASKFLAEAASQKGAKKTSSGLVYQQTQAGSGDSPTTKDKVTVHYTGKRRDGTVFDSSVERGEPADFPLARMIPCWTEGIQLMKPGGKAVITCPAALAYGDTGVPGSSGDMIPPGAALRFDVELIRVEKGAAENLPDPAPEDAP